MDSRILNWIETESDDVVDHSAQDKQQSVQDARRFCGRFAADRAQLSHIQRRRHM